MQWLRRIMHAMIQHVSLYNNYEVWEWYEYHNNTGIVNFDF